MDTYALQRQLLQAELLPTEKLVGMVLALHMDKRTGKIRVRQETVAQECGVDRPPVSYQTGHGCPQLKRKRAPWEYDLAHSTRPEEEEKRGHESFLREQEERRPNGGYDDGCTI